MTQATQTQSKGIQLTETALKHVLLLREQQGTDLCLRVGGARVVWWTEGWRPGR